MTNNTNTIVSANNFDMTTLLSILQNSKATVIVINNGTPVDMSNIIDTTATEVKKERVFDFHKYYVGRIKGVLNKHNIKVKTGMGGAKRGHISASAFDSLVTMLETKEVSFKRIKFLFDVLDEAGYTQEGRGLKNDVLYELLRYIKENNLVSYKCNSYYKVKRQYELDNLVEKLAKIPFTNNFAEKFANCLREDEVAYETFKLA